MGKKDGSNLQILDQFEVGGNIFELIEFSLDRKLPSGEIMRGTYGVNVAKVREVVRMPAINPLASSVSKIAGVFELRGIPIPAINLCHILGDKDTTISRDHQIIVTEFSFKRAGFIVSNTHRIRRVEWDKVLAPSSDAGSCMTGMILIENNEFLFILDLEKILNDIEIEAGGNGFSGNVSPYGAASSYGSSGASNNPPAPEVKLDKNAPGILLVDDSKLVLNNVQTALTRQGYRVAVAENGQIALNMLERIARGVDKAFGSINAIITDIEMPKMDGLTLTTRIRENPNLSSIPIILHTSLSGEAVMSAGQTVGADGYVVKNDIRCLFDKISEIINEKKFAIGA